MRSVDWALTRPDLSPPKQLLLVALAWISDEDGVTFKSQKTIAERIAKDPRWIRQHLPVLASEGYVSRLRRHRLNGSRTTDLIVLNLPRDRPLDLSVYDGIVGGVEIGDQEPSGGFSPGGLLAESCRPSGENPPPHREPLRKHFVELERERELVVARDADLPLSTPIVRFKGKPVPQEFVERSVAVLDAFNAVFDRKLRPFSGTGAPAAHLTEIIGKVIDHPDLDASDFERVIRNVKANPPDFTNGNPPDFGDIFGPRAWIRALGNNGQANGNVQSRQIGYASPSDTNSRLDRFDNIDWEQE